jgi:Late exocytosis, associated with Golgi transport
MHINRKFTLVVLLLVCVNAANDDEAEKEIEATDAMIRTLYTSIIFAVVIMLLFEANRRLKPIFLKRYREKFRVAHRVPPPPKGPFAWLLTVWGVSDSEFLRMVGLDGWMYIRYIIVCFKVSCFLFVMGSIVLLPVYATAGGDSNAWSRCTVANIPDKSSGQFWVDFFLKNTSKDVFELINIPNPVPTQRTLYIYRRIS